MAAAALILAACGNEEFIENVENGAAEQLVPMTFTANMPQTRTYLSGGTNVHWSEGSTAAAPPLPARPIATTVTRLSIPTVR